MKLAIILLLALAVTAVSAGRRRRRRSPRGLKRKEDTDFRWSCAGDDLGFFLQSSSEHNVQLQSCARLRRHRLRCLVNFERLPALVSIKIKCNKKKGWRPAELLGASATNSDMDATSAYLRFDNVAASDISRRQFQTAVASAINTAADRFVIQGLQVLVHGLAGENPLMATVTLAVPLDVKTAVSCGLENAATNNNGTILLDSLAAGSSAFDNATVTLEEIVFCSTCHTSYC
jgi:hypothetical protein